MQTEKISNVRAKTKYRLKDGSIAPGVTTVLNVLNKPALVPWANNLGLEGISVKQYVDKLASIGTLAHYLIECDLREVEPDTTGYSAEEMNLAENCLISYWEWKKTNNPEPILTEAKMVSEEYKFGGTIDLYCKINGELWLVDFKTGKAIYSEMITQLSAYRWLLLENGYKTDKVQILRIGRDETEGFEPQIKTAEELEPHWERFKSCLRIYQLNKIIGRE